MIRRLVALVFGHRCRDDLARVHAINLRAIEATENVIGRSLDMINASVEPEVGNYSPRQMSLVKAFEIIERVRRRGKAVVEAAGDSDVTEVAKGALKFLDKEE